MLRGFGEDRRILRAGYLAVGSRCGKCDTRGGWWEADKLPGRRAGSRWQRDSGEQRTSAPVHNEADIGRPMRWFVLANYVRCNSFPEERRKEAVACTP